MYKFTSTCVFLRDKDQVIIANRKNGQWIKISDEVMDILNIICVQDTAEDIEYADTSDKNYIESLVEKCCKMGVLLRKGSVEKVQNSLASIEMTHRCNLQCIHCCIDAKCNMTEKDDLTTGEMKNIFDKLIEWNPKTIMLSGGEPLLRRDFIELATYLRKCYNGKIIISTNGILINCNNVKDLIQVADQMEISLDGYDEQTCSLVRGRGVFGKVMSAVSLLQKNGFRNISLSMTVSDNNESWEKNFIELNNKLGTRPNCRIFSPTGRGEENKEFFTNLPNDQVYIPTSFIQKERDEQVSFSCCSAGNREIFVDYKGDIYPCPSYVENTYKLGNILKINKIEDITVEYNHLDMIIQRLKSKGINAERCKKCNVNIFCWGCPGAVEFFNTQKALDYQCKIVFPLLKERVWKHL